MRIVALIAVLAMTCGAPAVAPTPTASPRPLAVAELKYRVFEQIGRPWYCDPDFYPIQRQDEAVAAEQRLPEIQREVEAYAAILRHNGLTAPPVTADQKLAVYRDWKQLNALGLQPLGDVYGFTVLVQAADGAKDGTRVEGRIDRSGRITVLRKELSGPPVCPICLSAETLVGTPDGPRAVMELRVGDVVWTLDGAGRRVAAPLLRVGSMEAPAGHEVVRLALEDGRVVTASPGHPIADGRPIGQLRIGETVDAARVVAIERLPYRGRTYDLLPSGATGAYLANGVPLATTIR